MSLPVKDGNGTLTSVKTVLEGSDHVPFHNVNNLPTDPSTGTLQASILAKILSAPSTEAKQDAIVTAIGLLGTQTTVAAILAKLIAAPATETKQDTQITSLGTLATQTTLAAVLAKIIATPATEAKQDTLLAALLPTLSNFRSLTVNSTAQAVKASAGELWGFNIINTDTSNIYVKIYNIAAASVNPASDLPILTLMVPANGAIYQEPACRLNVHSTAISVRAVTGTGDTNTTAPSGLPIIEIKYS